MFYAQDFENTFKHSAYDAPTLKTIYTPKHAGEFWLWKNHMLILMWIFTVFIYCYREGARNLFQHPSNAWRRMTLCQLSQHRQNASTIRWWCWRKCNPQLPCFLTQSSGATQTLSSHGEYWLWLFYNLHQGK